MIDGVDVSGAAAGAGYNWAWAGAAAVPGDRVFDGRHAERAEDAFADVRA